MQLIFILKYEKIVMELVKNVSLVLTIIFSIEAYKYFKTWIRR